jgi:hypothetical protein
MKRWGVMTAVVLAALCAGCFDAFELDQTVTLNPDGSGKAEFKLIMSAPGKAQGQIFGAEREANLSLVEQARKEKMSPGEFLSKAAQVFIERSEGVDAWEDVDFSLLNDGRLAIRGTAYFPDLGEFKLGLQNAPEYGWDAENKVLAFDAEMGPQGQIKKATHLGPDHSDDEPEPDEKAPEPTAEEIKRELMYLRIEYQQARPMFAALAAMTDFDVTYKLPGKLGSHGSFTKVDDRTVRIAFRGEKALRRMDEVIMADNLMRPLVREVLMRRKAGDEDEKDEDAGDALFQFLWLGDTRAPRAKLAGEGKPQFDYAAAVKKAKAAEQEMFKPIGGKPE